ncbi:MAG: lysophospholipid acyltransferase family protein, partial [Candidatus Adiutrix sp.]|nr:lysophospholipid acyltransferase family protein [Candidatus Adiutrix sp.]
MKFLDWPAWAGRLMLLFSRTWRLRVINQPDPDGGLIFAHWHGDDLILTPTMRHMKTAILVSPSRDGEMLSRALTALGHRPYRGSSARGGAAGLLALKQALAEGRNPVFAADGPRGPRLVAKTGPAFLAAKTGRPLYPAGVAVSRAYVFRKSWHQTRLPLPGAKVVVVFGPPLWFPPEAARWPAHHLSRLVGAALADAALAA